MPTERARRSSAMDRRSWLSLLSGGLAFSSLGWLTRSAPGVAVQVVGATPPSLSALSVSGQVSPTSLLAVQGTKTPVEQFFVRNHHNQPDLTLGAWKLRLEGKVARPMELSFADLLEAPTVKLESVLECAGNDAEGLLVSSGVWEGVPMSYFLQKASPHANADRIMLLGADAGSLLGNAPSFPYARVVPMSRCLSDDSLVAIRLNNRLLPRRNGFPARALFPGEYAMDSVKWLQRMVVLGPNDFPDAYYRSGMDLLYRKVFEQPGGLREGSRVGEILVKSQIVYPPPGSRLVAGHYAVTGLAWCGESTIRAIVISTDGGKTWRPAQVDGTPKRFAWVRWHYDWEAREGQHLLMSRAQDSTGNWQPLARDGKRKDGYELNWCAPSRYLVG